jgi:hypothetical protein
MSLFSLPENQNKPKKIFSNTKEPIKKPMSISPEKTKSLNERSHSNQSGDLQKKKVKTKSKFPSPGETK